MEKVSFYNFDVTSGSGIQAGALFDIFDSLASIGIEKRSQIVVPTSRAQSIMGDKKTNEGDP